MLRPAWMARPLDPLRSIKIKLGVLVVTSVFVSTLLMILGLRAEVQFRYTFVVTSLASLAVTLLLAHGMTSPLREMTAAARAMARGDYSRRVRATSRDEVGQLASAFNRMASDLEQVDRHRRELVANVSHELRTPIAGLQALLENMVDGVWEPDKERLEQALTQTERLGRLVADLLDLSRLDAGVVPLHAREFAVRPFLESVLREAESLGHDVVFVVDVEPAALTAVADTERLHQVVTNLLANACRHSPPGGRVSLHAHRAHDAASGSLRLEVQDQGPGIPREERTRVFERFIRGGDRSGPGGGAASGYPGGRRREGGGTGLGLAIARWAVDLHGGEIAVAESAYGCRIRVVLPGDTRDARS
ncbi:HAMP domain-containing sensor histidine kinase [Yinghuangia seranimata]|uniref:HAMP domain-containing sensor histidine kinase n=1 Tax=Yinghuangia seranimata TaxID=408067 RepID=UPI00248D2537|nr:HAMP domain-containing sensor histidine kinase [Yinghuangia seranimata]MDI2131503.1 ATP-binding protein [Yinghuangia seranimata]